MKDFEKKLIEGAYTLKEQIVKSKHALENNDRRYNISGEELNLIEMNIHAMEISYNCLVKRIELRHLTKDFADYCVRLNSDIPF